MRSLVLSRSNFPLLVIAVVALALLIAPYPGASFSVVATRLITSIGSALAGVSFLSDGFLMLLAAVTAAALVWAWHAAPERRPATVFASLGVAAAYAVSEGAKPLIGQLRPCTQWPTAGECPIADFSLPSNHATLAFAAVWVIALATQRVWLVILATSIALIVAIGRVLEGMHYVHDVAAGVLVGLMVPALLTAAGLTWERARRASRRQ
ncbi:phosphatase PAP2 family protein [Microbacterium sp. AK031]|uniref:phosphatase PAP2 family protein n=1 Tax=Microbacterium sp. AK031 TaxID=2723076 RepID=UPI00216AAF38|nr:phosphatase PAP2 family protein [Microbacterium sp. AK031]MCS3844016.1 undecaprenyl-diphosphatase [Microbacterium sp. AK031]